MRWNSIRDYYHRVALVNIDIFSILILVTIDIPLPVAMRIYWLTSSFRLLNCNKNLLVRNLSGNTQINGEKAEATLPPTLGEVADKVTSNAQQQQRSLHIAVIGVPNVGKSTFINNIINHRVRKDS